jgi:hypothetical protein
MRQREQDATTNTIYSLESQASASPGSVVSTMWLV